MILRIDRDHRAEYALLYVHILEGLGGCVWSDWACCLWACGIGILVVVYGDGRRLGAIPPLGAVAHPRGTGASVLFWARERARATSCVCSRVCARVRARARGRGGFV